MNAMQIGDTFTANGAVSHSTTGNFNVDLFFSVGASRGKDLSAKFLQAYAENPDYAVRILQYTRDVRGGLGERKMFIDLFQTLVTVNPTVAKELIIRTPELGRWKDLVEIYEASTDKEIKEACLYIFHVGLLNEHGLCAKWAPRKGKFSSDLARKMGLDRKQYRKLVVGLSNTVEQKMCARQWDQIDFSKLPSVAAARYQKAFWKNAKEQYEAYVAKLKAGDKSVKVNAGAVFPYDVIQAGKNSNDWTVAEAQWKALPDLLNGTTRGIIPIIDVSPSMDCSVPNTSVSCKDVAIGLGLYVAQRNNGPFKDEFITFSSEPAFINVSGLGLKDAYIKTARSDWGGTTNLVRTFKVILEKAKQYNVAPEDMPEDILIVSDMEFDFACTFGYYDSTNFETIDNLYAESGYKRPRIVFWRVNVIADQVPVKAGEAGTALVSGFSPAILRGVMTADMENFTPMSVMLETIMIDKYKI